MSEPIRYNVKCGDEGYTIVESLGGEWVHHSDYASLKAEVERLRNLGIKLDGYVDLLQGENERLRKAGDIVCESPYLWETDPAVIAWRAAKEGKPSV
jgi:hypothetical protein